MAVLDVHSRSLAKSTALSEYYDPTMILPLDVISVLNRARISFVLVGLHGVSGWMKEPRATQDVDIIVSAKHHKKALRELIVAFPNLEADEQEVVTRLRDRATHEVAIDVMKPNELYRAAFKHTETITAGKQKYRIPCLEMALAMKFAPMISLNRREEDKLQDAHDFILMVKANRDIDLKKLSELGDLVYSTGGIELLELVRKVRAGEKLLL